MESYKVSIDGQTYTVNSPQPLTDEQAYLAVKGEHEKVMGNRKAAIEADQAAERQRFKEAEAARPLGERVMTNIGAGVHTLGEGLQQLGGMVGIGKGVSDEELQESRQRKAQLAEGTKGGEYIQMAGEVLPTLLVPGGALARGATAAPKVGRVLKAALGGPRTLRSAALDAGLAGAATGALQPVLTDESRLGNTLMGAAGGAGGAAAVGGLVRGLPLATAAGRQRYTANRAGERVAREIGDEVAQADVLRRLEAPRGGTDLTAGVPLTAAEKAGAPELIGLEAAARRDLPQAFAGLERQQNEALFDAAMRAGREGTDTRIGRLDTVRQGRTGPMREDVMEKAGRFPDVAVPLQREVDALRSRSAAGSPQRRLADLVEESVQERANPAQLYELRKLLANKLSGPYMPGDEVAGIVKGAQKETRAMMDAIDARLNEAAQRKGGTQTPFTDYLNEFTARSGPVDSARAQQLINRELSDAGRPIVGQAPEITRNVLKRALEKHGVSKRFGTKLEPGAQARYNEVMDLMKQMEEPMRTTHLAGTGGGGSRTAWTQAAGKFGREMASETPFVGALAKPISARVDEAVQREVAQMMLDPARAAAGIRRTLQAGQPLNEAEQRFLLQLRAAGSGTGGALLTQQPTQ